MGDFGFLGWTEKKNSPFRVECDIAVDSTTNIVALGKTTNASVTFGGAPDGVDHAQRQHICPVGVQSGDGKATVKFIGAAAEQV